MSRLQECGSLESQLPCREAEMTSDIRTQDVTPRRTPSAHRIMADKA